MTDDIATASHRPSDTTIPIRVCCSVQGDHFTPASIQMPDEVKWTAVNNPGDLGTLGRYKGMPIPYGCGTLELRNPAHDFTDIEAMIQSLTVVIQDIAHAGADCQLDLDFGAQTITGVQFTPQEMNFLATNNVPLTITVWGGKDDDT